MLLVTTVVRTKVWLFDKVYCNINISHAKCLAFVLVLLITGCRMGNYIPDKITFKDKTCGYLLEDGRYVAGKYQPLGCTIHYYTTSEARQCLLNRYHQLNESLAIYFYGASKIRNLYFGLVSLLSGTNNAVKVHHDVFFNDSKLHMIMHYYWSMLHTGNRTPLYQQLVDRVDQKNNQSKKETMPDIIINGAGTHVPGKYGDYNNTQHVFRKFLKSFLPLLTNIGMLSRVVFILHEDLEERKLKNPNNIFTTTTFQGFNDAMESIFNNSPVDIWRSVRSVASGSKNPTRDGLHLNAPLIKINTQILFNWFCNKYITLEEDTCCRTQDKERNVAFFTEALTPSQILIAFITTCSAVVVVAMLLPKYIRFLRTNDNDDTELTTLSVQDNDVHSSVTEVAQEIRAVDLFACIARVGVIMAYFFLCDRTKLFKTEEKHYSLRSFLLPLGFVALAGIVFHSKSKYKTVLHRDQTDEWKGWMQLVILIYHYTGASKVLPIYMHIQVLVSSYLFLSGFGHFYAYFTKADFSTHRFCTVLFRYNFLVIVCCLTMNRSYQFYYFMPLVSFWFVILHVVMSIWPRVLQNGVDLSTVQYTYVLLKVALLVGIITRFYASDTLFQHVFMSPVLRYFFTTDDGSLHEWRFRWSIDRYSTVYGILLAIVILISKSKNYFDDSTAENLFSSWKVAFITIVSVFGLMAYLRFSCCCKEKESCNEVHALIAFIPILSFVVLRNIFGWIRNRFSYVFSWFGRISLELFISQYHIWLASDTHELLVLVENQPLLNFCITSFILVCIAHEIHSVTVKLVPYVIPKDWKLIFRNLAIISILLNAFLLPKK